MVVALPIPPLVALGAAAVAAVIAGLGLYVWKTGDFPVKLSVKEISAWIYANILEPVANLFKSLVVSFRYIREVFIEFVNAASETISTLADWIVAAVRALRSEIAAVLTEHVLPLAGRLEDLKKFVLGTVLERIATLSENFVNLRRWIETHIMEEIRKLATQLVSLTKAVETLQKMLTDLRAWVTATFATPAIVQNLIDKNVNRFREPVEEIVKDATTALEILEETTKDPLMSFWLAAFGSTVLENIDEVVERMTRIHA